MGVSKSNKQHQCYIAVPSQIINSLPSSALQTLLEEAPKKKTKTSDPSKLKLLLTNPRFWIFLLFLFAFAGILLNMWLNFDPFSQYPCPISQEKGQISTAPQLSIAAVNEKSIVNEKSSEFWKQPDGLGYMPCLEFSAKYRKASVEILKDRNKYLMVVVSGGMNQQRNQIVDAVVIARILGAALVVPIFQVNPIWGDERFLFSTNFCVFFQKWILLNFLRYGLFFAWLQ